MFFKKKDSTIKELTIEQKIDKIGLKTLNDIGLIEVLSKNIPYLTAYDMPDGRLTTQNGIDLFMGYGSNSGDKEMYLSDVGKENYATIEIVDTEKYIRFLIGLYEHRYNDCLHLSKVKVICFKDELENFEKFINKLTASKDEIYRFVDNKLSMAVKKVQSERSKEAEKKKKGEDAVDKLYKNLFDKKDLK